MLPRPVEKLWISVNLHCNLTSSFQVIGNLIIRKNAKKMLSRSKVKVKHHHSLVTSGIHRIAYSVAFSVSMQTHTHTHAHIQTDENNSRGTQNQSKLSYLVLRSSDNTGSSATAAGRLDGKTVLIRCSPM